MSYEYKRLRRDKASIIPIEETYTDLDINPHDDSIPAVGYRFDSPHRWVVSRYLNKAIGIRDLKLTPSSGDIRCKFLAYNKAALGGRRYTWDEDSSKYVSGSTWRIFETGEYRCISDDYDIQVTPENNFEEIITEMLKFINDASWKSIENNGNNEYDVFGPREHDTSRHEFYFTESTEDDETTHTNLNYINNFNYLKLPLTYTYEFDANKCVLDVLCRKELRGMIMLNRSKSDADRTKNNIKIPEYSKISNGITYYYYLRHGFKLNQQKTVSGSDLDIVYLGNGCIRSLGNELLLIIRLDDKSSIKAIYDLFNQPMPDDISTLPVVNLEDGLYVIPFADKDTFKSHFCYGTGTTQSNYNNTNDEEESLSANNDFIATNLKLDNVWDRLHLIYHASFADTRHRIIGRNGDHWDTPNKQFIVPTGDQAQFYLRFTTDGTHSILPIGCHFNVDLCFMLNPTSNTATPGNHDHFKD